MFAGLEEAVMRHCLVVRIVKSQVWESDNLGADPAFLSYHLCDFELKFDFPQL